MDGTPGDEILIGRERERSELDRAIVAAHEGRSELLLLTGEAGIGKTFLARQCVARGGLLVLRGEAHQDLTPPYGPLTMALRSLNGQVPRDSSLSAAAASPLALVSTKDGTAPVHAARATLFEAFRAALAAIAEFRPTALFLDDLQWADSATLELLPPLASELERAPLLLVGAYRSDEVARGHPVRRLRSELRRMRRLHEVTVEPFDREQTAELLARTLGSSPSPELTTALYDRTEGVPFLIEELAVALASSGRLHQGASSLELAAGDDLPLPESVRDAVLLRISGLSARARQALDIAAVAGQTFHIDLITTLAGDEGWVSELLQHGLIAEVALGEATFRHALTREACYAQVAWPRRRALHRQLAAHLAAVGAAPAVVAGHWLAGREPNRARTALLTGAEAAWQVHAYRDASKAFGRALELWPEGAKEAARLDALERMGQCAEMAGSLAEATRIWREVSEARRRTGETRKLAVVERRLAGVYELQGDWERALASRDAAATSFAARGLPGDAAAEWLLSAAHLRSAGSYRAALSVLDLARSEAERAGRRDLQARIFGLEGNIRARQGDSEAGLALVGTGLALALEHNLAGPAAELYPTASLSRVVVYPLR